MVENEIAHIGSSQVMSCLVDRLGFQLQSALSYIVCALWF